MTGESMRHHILIYDKHNSIIDYMLADLKSRDNVQLDYVIQLNCGSSNRPVYFIKKLYGKILWQLRKQIWYHGLKRQDGHVIITNEAMLGLDRKDIVRLQQMGKRVIGLFIDPLKADYLTISRAKDAMDLFDAVYTFDPLDATQFGLQYTNQLYSPIKPADSKAKAESDLYYIGHVKGRKAFIESLIKNGRENGASLDIQLAGPGEQVKSIPGVKYLAERKPYECIISDLLSSRCILDITQEGQAGITLRYYEAVVYNKKLITNNEYITNLPYYDKRFMRIYHSIDDFDWGCIQDTECPDYHYAGDFSPVHLMERIDSADMGPARIEGR